MMSVKTNKTEKETPLMKQYYGIKAKYPDALLLFRVGDFYETFSDDAIRASKILGIVLTQRKNGAASSVELAGFPHHSLDTYLPKLVKAGLRVAVCDQLEDPKLTKTIVKRGITELVTPGVSINDNVLDQKKNNFLCALHFKGETAGISFLDISTGEFLLAEGSIDYIEKLIQSFQPGEILYCRQDQQRFKSLNLEKYHPYGIEDWVYQYDFAFETLTRHFETKNLKGFGVENQQLGIIAAGVALHYLSETRNDKIKHIANLSRIEEDKYVWLDRFTIQNLELFQSPNQGATTLIDIIDNTSSPMGARLLKRWLSLPLKQISAINQRLDVVECFIKNNELRESLFSIIKEIGDLERLVSKTAIRKVSPKELLYLKHGLEAIKPIKEKCLQSNNEQLIRIADNLNTCQWVIDKIEKEIHPEAGVAIGKGNTINNFVHAELDELRNLSSSGKDKLLDIQKRESELTGITSLKVSFNNVFGYYLEVTNVHKAKVPETWIRKQTLVNAERYITEELKEYESKILGAEEKIFKLETEIFDSLLQSLSDYIISIQQNAQLLAQIDCLLSFSLTAIKYNYSKPFVNNSKALSIEKGRHPVIETRLPIGEEYVPNSVFIDDVSQQIIMITGPNMSGKSALLRQTALIVLLAQIGCFVPAEKAEIGLIDKIFTRVGASDNISQGESTFMVEMNETASILNNLSDRSLLLLDEIGRGTSTYDGISIAWSIAEFLHDHPHKPKTLFATHYHELNDMSASFERIKNFNVSIKEIEGKVIFLRNLVPGGSEHSFGIHVAKIAGMPKEVIRRANQLLEELEETHSKNQKSNGKTKIKPKQDMQLSFFQLDDPVLVQIKEELLKTDINILTPIEALMKLNEIKKILGG